MKKIIISLVFASFSFYSQGQPSENTCVDSIIHNTYPTDDTKRVVNRTYFTYDNSGNLIEVLDYSWDNKIVKPYLDFKEVYEYDADNNKIYCEMFRWDTLKKEWFSFSKNLISYDKLGNKVVNEKYQYDYLSNNMIGFSKDSSIFNSMDLVIEENSFKWDTIVNNWRLYYKLSYDYNSKGNLVTENRFHRSDTSWILSNRVDYVYGNNPDFKITINFSHSNDTLNFYSKDSIVYNDEGLRLLHVKKFWSSSDSRWLNSSKYIYEYANTQLIKEVKFIELSGKWTGLHQYLYAFDDFGNQTSNGYYEWDYELNDWELIHEVKLDLKYENDLIIEKIETYKHLNENSLYDIGKLKHIYKYDQFNRTEFEILYAPHIGDWQEQIKKEYIYNTERNYNLIIEYNWDKQNTSWVVFKEYYTYYSINNLDVEPNKIEKQLQLYPNPVDSYLYIDNQSLIDCVANLISIDGKIIKQYQLSKNKNYIDMKDVISGLYFLQVIYNKNESATYRIIKK